jgi:hypothetical protein
MMRGALTEHPIVFACAAIRPGRTEPNARYTARILPYSAALSALLAFAVVILASAVCAEDSEIEARRKSERTAFTDTEIADGFFKTTFGAEMNLAGRRSDRIRKYDVPVRVYVDSRATPDRRAEIAKVVEDIRARVNNLDIAITTRRKDANMLVHLVRDRNLNRTIRRVYGREQGNKIVRALDPQCLSRFRKDESYRIVDSDIILVADAGDFIFYDCAYEEILQALGPINDDESVAWSMFNDNVQMGYFDIYDQFILNILYDPRIKPGMTREEVELVFPAILQTVRVWVARVNGLKGE